MAEYTSPHLAIHSHNRKKLYDVDDYTFMEDAYRGAGGFKDGDYLEPHPRETALKYYRRKRLSYYLNYVKTVIDSHVDPIFQKIPDRMWGVNVDGGATPLFDKFMKDVDTNGTGIDRFMKRAAKEAKKHGVAFIVVDNFSQQPERQLDAIQSRVLPYAYIVRKRDVTNYTTDGAGRITSITYQTITETSGGSTSKTTSWKWTADTWEKSGEGETAAGVNPLGSVPVVALFSSDCEPGNLSPASDFYSIARTNAALFNLCSWLAEILQNQGFAILTYPVSSSQQASEVQEIIVGTESVLGYDGGLTNTPSFIAPPGEMAAALQTERANMIQEIYRMAILSHVTGVQEQKSGVAKAWDFNTTNMVLADFAQNCETAEKKMAALVEAYTGETTHFDVIYSRNFGIDDVAGILAQIQAGKDLQIGGAFDMALHKKAAATLLADLPDEAYDAVIKDIGDRSEEKDNAAKISAEAAANAAKYVPGNTDTLEGGGNV